ncbi:MAG: hypothetical protein WCE61_23645, partial [Candidatus Acidiferrum sp.]
MGKTFDIGLDRLTGGVGIPHGGSPGHKQARAEAEKVAELAGFHDSPRGTFFLETFGCQMNDHDSEKVAGVLLSR